MDSTSTQRLNLDCIVQRDPNILSAIVDNDLVMVSVTSGYYYGLSDVAREIWESIERPKKISKIVSGLLKRYVVDHSTCLEQTLLFIETLSEEGLLRVINGQNR